jgi:hypothetical protein
MEPLHLSSLCAPVSLPVDGEGFLQGKSPLPQLLGETLSGTASSTG